MNLKRASQRPSTLSSLFFDGLLTALIVIPSALHCTVQVDLTPGLAGAFRSSPSLRFHTQTLSLAENAPRLMGMSRQNRYLRLGHESTRERSLVQDREVLPAAGVEVPPFGG